MSAFDPKDVASYARASSSQCGTGGERKAELCPSPDIRESGETNEDDGHYRVGI